MKIIFCPVQRYYYRELRYQKVEKRYKGCLSEHTLARMIECLKSNNKPSILLLMMHLTYFEPEKQLRILKEVPLGPRYLGILVCPVTLAHETIDSILATDKPSVWDLGLCRAYWHVDKWANVELQDLIDMDIDSTYSGCDWSISPVRTAVQSLPYEILKSFSNYLIEKSKWSLDVFICVLYGNTELKPAEITEWIRQCVQKADAKLIQRILKFCADKIYINYKQKHLLAIIEEYRCRENISIADFRKVFEDLIIKNEEQFWNCPSWNVEQLSKETVDMLFVILAADDCTDQFRRCLLHLMSSEKNAEQQIQILGQSPLGPHYIYHTKHPVNDRSRFHYPGLAKGTIDDLMKKTPPTVWDLAICAQQRKDVRERLAKVSPQELLQLADVRDDHETGCASVHTSCWDNELCWDNSLIKVAFEALPAQNRDAFLREPRVQHSVWFRFALRYALKEESELKDEELIALANDSLIAHEIVSARPGLISSLEDEMKTAMYTHLQRAMLDPNLLNLLKNLQSMYKDATLHNIPAIEAAIEYIKPRLMFTKNGCYEVRPSTDTNVFSPLPTDIFNMICQKYLYPAERRRLASACIELRYRIYSDKGQDIWINEGSIRSAQLMEQLTNTIEETMNFTPDQLILNKILARAWPRNFWPKSKQPRWIRDL